MQEIHISKIARAGVAAACCSSARRPSRRTRQRLPHTKTDINPFFVKMREGAQAKAQELGITLPPTPAGSTANHETQVQAVEPASPSGADGILITASDTKAITDVLQQARDQGIL